MSSDPYADLGTSLGKFANSFRDLLDHAPDGVPGSAAAADYDCYADEWGEHPGRGVVASVLLTSWSCADHLAAAAVVMPERRCISSLYSLMRGAAEAAAVACYLTADGIDALERVRRDMNLNLAALYEDTRMIGKFTSPASQERAARHNSRVEAIVRTGELSGFRLPVSARYHKGSSDWLEMARLPVPGRA